MVNPSYNNPVTNSNQDRLPSITHNELNLHSLNEFNLENLDTIKSIDNFIKNNPGKFKFEDINKIQTKLLEKITELKKETSGVRNFFNFIFRHHIYFENKEKLKTIENLNKFLKTIKPYPDLETTDQIENPLIAHSIALEQVDVTTIPPSPPEIPPPPPLPGSGKQANLPKPKEKMFENEPELPSFDSKIGSFNQKKVEKEIPIIEKYLQDSLAALGITKPMPEEPALLSRSTKKPSISMPDLNSNIEEVPTTQEVKKNKSFLDVNTVRQKYEKDIAAYKALTIEQILKEKREETQKNLSYILINLPLLYRQSLVRGSQESDESFVKRQKEEIETVEKQAKILEELKDKKKIFPSTVAESMEQIRYLTEKQPDYDQLLKNNQNSLNHLNKLLQKFSQAGNLEMPIKIETKSGELIETKQTFYEKEEDFKAENKKRADLKQKPLPDMYLKSHQKKMLEAKKIEMEVNVNQLESQVSFIKGRLAQLREIKNRDISLNEENVKLFDTKILKLKEWESGLKIRRNRLSDVEKAKQPTKAKDLIPNLSKEGHDLLMKSQVFSVAASKGDISQYFDI